ncbi:hypothetical protein [Hymenobacter radiodurans]|uniref:hypothetical protein n=1 Tax=Hymenobacter radiodurans TaxID=2496028 RepID=UPI00140548AE|nr:hypothetical protein [Hymenobacter radiodurans]
MRLQKKDNARHVIAIGWLMVIGSVALLAPWLPLPFPPDSIDLNHVAQSPFLPPTTLQLPITGLGPMGLVATC